MRQHAQLLMRHQLPGRAVLSKRVVKGRFLVIEPQFATTRAFRANIIGERYQLLDHLQAIDCPVVVAAERLVEAITRPGCLHPRRSTSY